MLEDKTILCYTHSMQRIEIIHPIPPFYRPDSEILILGSFPSVKSREQKFFYGHPQNRFWKVLAEVYSDSLPDSISDKRAFLERHCIALWDCIGKCSVEGSADSSIRDVVPNDLSVVLNNASIRAIYCNGKTSYNCYSRYIAKTIERDAVVLPSTSPANAAYPLDRLTEAWRIIRC